MRYLVDIGELVNVVATSPQDALQLAYLSTCCGAVPRGQMRLPFIVVPAVVYEQGGAWQIWREEAERAA